MDWYPHMAPDLHKSVNLDFSDMGTLAFKIALVISFDTKRRGFRNWSFDATAN